MANILDYLFWRGDIALTDLALCDVDLLVLSRMAYLPFDGIVPGEFTGEGISLKQACLAVSEKSGKSKKSIYRMDEDEKLVSALIDSPRFAEIKLCGFANTFDEKKEEQFCALAAILPDKTVAVIFRGTDGTLVGWKEDFNMAITECVASQTDSVSYLKSAARAFPLKPIVLAGHSKGGNLAVYAAAFCKKSIQNRITAVRNFDGPGFMEETLAKLGFSEILPKVRTILPNSSVVGMLLEHDEKFSIIASKSVGILQHNIYMWDIVRGGFELVSSLTDSSRFIDSTLKLWVEAMDREKREKMINGIYGVLSACEGKALKDLFNGKNTLAVIKAAGEMDEETKNIISETFKVLADSMKTSASNMFESISRKDISAKEKPAREIF